MYSLYNFLVGGGYEKELVDMIPTFIEPLQILHVGARNGAGTMKIMERLRERNIPFDLDVYEYSDKWKFYLSFIVPQKNIYTEWLPDKKVYDYIFVSDATLFTRQFIRAVVSGSTDVLIAVPKFLKHMLEYRMNIKKSLETHFIYGLYMCELYA
jgi:hypothetical protein